MKKILLLLLLSFALFADMKNIEASSQNIVKLNMKIIDIRTPGEWQQTGIVPMSKTLMFFDERGGYNIQKFLTELNAIVKPKEEFAILCRSGSRTKTLAPFLAQQGYNVVNLVGGINHYMATGGKTTKN